MTIAPAPATDLQLLRAYVDEKSDEAFRLLIQRHGPWLLPLAHRQLGDRHLAEDATQVVFILLAQRAGTMRSNSKLSGWLFNTLQFSVKNLIRARRRRRLHESHAAIQADVPIQTPMPDTDLALRVDAAVAHLSSAHRHLILLRFYQDRTFPEIASILGISEVSARKRFSRAADILRQRLGNNALPDAQISVVLAAAAVQTLPHALATVALAAKAGASIPATLVAATKGTVSLMAMSKLKVAGVAALMVLLLGGGATFLIVARHHFLAAAFPVHPAEAPMAGPIPFAPDLKSVQTFYFHDTGNGLSFNDVYLTRNKGMLQRQAAPGWSTIRYFQDQTEWAYREGGNLVLREKHAPRLQDKGVSLAEMVAATESTLSLANVQAIREPDADAVIDGVACQAFRVPEKLLNAPADSILLINPTSQRAVRVTFGTTDSTIGYDPPLPEELFKLPDGPKMRIVDARSYFEEQYPLDGAVFTAEGLGQTFAIHQVQQDAAGCFHVVCSTRIASPGKSAVADLTDDQLVVGFSPTASIAGHRFHAHVTEVAAFQQSGIMVSYFLVFPDPGVNAGDHCQFGITLNASEDVHARFAAAGVSMGSPAIAVDVQAKPDPGAPTALAFASHAYDVVSPLVGMVDRSHMSAPANMGQGLASQERYLGAVKADLVRYAPNFDQTP